MKLTAASLLVFVASIASAQDMSGHYVLHGVMEMGSELLLKPDGTFEYMMAYGAADYHAKGLWKSEKGSVILNTTGKEEPPFRFLRSESSGDNTRDKVIRVWVKGANGQPVPNIDVALEPAAADTSPQKTMEDGAALFSAGSAPTAVRFAVRVYSLETDPFPVNKAHNNFYFEINGEAITQVRFKDERLQIDGKELELRFWNKERPMRFARE